MRAHIVIGIILLVLLLVGCEGNVAGRAAKTVEKVFSPQPVAELSKLRPFLVDTTGDLNRENPDDRDSIVGTYFIGNNQRFFTGVQNKNHVQALPYEPNIREKMGEDVCRYQVDGQFYSLGDYTDGTEGDFNAYCRWSFRGRKKTVGRYFKAHFDMEEINGQLKGVVVKLRHALGSNKKETGIHIFLIEEGNPRWQHKKYCVINN